MGVCKFPPRAQILLSWTEVAFLAELLLLPLQEVTFHNSSCLQAPFGLPHPPTSIEGLLYPSQEGQPMMVEAAAVEAAE